MLAHNITVSEVQTKVTYFFFIYIFAVVLVFGFGTTPKCAQEDLL